MHFIEHVRAYLDELANRLEQAGIDVDLNDLSLSFSLDDEPMPYLLKVHQVTQEIWVSSPLKGGHRFRWDEGTQTWQNIRTHQELDSTLQEELAVKGFSFLIK